MTLSQTGTSRANLSLFNSLLLPMSKTEHPQAVCRARDCHIKPTSMVRLLALGAVLAGSSVVATAWAETAETSPQAPGADVSTPATPAQGTPVTSGTETSAVPAIESSEPDMAGAASSTAAPTPTQPTSVDSSSGMTPPAPATTPSASAGEGAMLDATVAQAPVAPAPPTFPKVGGHVGVATPLLTVADETTSIADGFTMLNPIGISVILSKRVVVDFETVVISPVDPAGSPGFIVDPGVVLVWDGFATGLRVAWQIHPNRPTVGLIPLINTGLVDLGGATWFVEGAFPTFYRSEPQDVEFNVVLHTGVGF